MKKRTALLFLLLCSVCLLFGCEHELVDDPAGRISGYWECAKIQTDENVYENTLPVSDNVEVPLYAFYSMAFADDGPGYIVPYGWMYHADDRQKDGFRWTYENNILTLNGSDNNTLSLEYTNGQLFMDMGDDVKMWLNKVDKFTEYDSDKWLNEMEDADK